MNKNTNQVENSKLSSTLKPRHVTMISLGGVIGAGIFAASGSAIFTAGPALLLSYIFSIILLIFIMMMLGEMAIAQPDTGSFSTYAAKAMGIPAGFSVGWLYWSFWVLTIGVQATAGATIASTIFSGPKWLWALILIVLLTGLNMLGTSNFAEAEFWLGFTKIFSITVFIILGFLAIFGWLPNSNVSGISQLTANGGFMPNGFKAVLIATLTTSFTFMGSEVVTIAAAEAENPQESIRKSIFEVIRRNIFFYLGTIFVIVSLVPWNIFGDPNNSQRAFQVTLEKMNIPHAGGVMNVIMLLAIVSCLNSSIYTGSRMFYSLAKNGYAPKRFSKVSNQSTPYLAVLISVIGGIAAVLGNIFLPDNIFAFLLGMAGCLALFVYLSIAVTQIILRNKANKAGEKLSFKIWGFPYLSYLTIVFILFILGFMLSEPAQRAKAIASIILCALVIGFGAFWARTRTNQK